MQKRNISAGILQNPMGLRQAQLSETQLPASLNFAWKSKTIISVKTIKMQHRSYIHSPCGSIQMSMEWVSTAELDRKRPLQKNIEEDMGRVPVPLGLPPTFLQCGDLHPTGYKWATACNSYQRASFFSMSSIPFPPNPSFLQIFAHFYKTGIDVLPILKNAFETTNRQCYNTMLNNSSLLYNERKRTIFHAIFQSALNC